MLKGDGGGAAAVGPFAHYTSAPSVIYAQADAITRSAGGPTTVQGNVLANHTTALAGVTGDLTAPMTTAPRPIEQATGQVVRAALVGGGCVRLWGNAVTNFNRDVDMLNNEYQAAAVDNFGVTKPVVPDSAARHSVEDSYDDDVADAKAAKLAELKRRYAALVDLLDTAADQVASMLKKGPDDRTNVVTLFAAGALPAAAAARAWPGFDPRNHRLVRGPDHWHSWWNAAGDPPVWMKGSFSSKDGPGLTILGLKGGAYLLQGGGPGLAPGTTYAYNIGAEGDVNSNIGQNGIGVHIGGKAGAWGSYDGGPAEAPYGTGQAKADGFVGGEANFDAHADGNSVGVGAGAMAGARVGGQITNTHEASGISVTTRSEAWGGYGAKGGWDMSVDDGQWHIRADAGAAYELGAKLGIDVTIDPDKLLP
jgi:hypothetical protein